MSKEKQEEKVSIISRNDYIPELEEHVKKYMLSSYSRDPVKKIYSRIYLENFKDPKEQELWEMEEIRRCIEGHAGLNPKMYFWFNYVTMENLKKGKIFPEFRVADMDWFDELMYCKESVGWGALCVKRRRAGFSWKAAADALHDVMFSPNFYVGMNSKSERDSVILFRKVKFIYDNLPSFLKASVGSLTASKMEFFKKITDDQGNPKRVGLNSSIITVPPNDSAYEGMMLGKWICDEAGKIANLPQMWSYTEDCLMQETERVGVPVIFGTAGEVGKEGAGLKDLWDNSDARRLRKFFFSGYMGVLVDRYGNDMKEEAIRWVVYERRRRETLSKKEYNDFIQKYPLTINEAFSQAQTKSLGDIELINLQLASLSATPAPAKRGKFIEDMDSEEVMFVPRVDGDCIIYEEPAKDSKYLYIAGCDPADHDDPKPGASNMSMFIMKKATADSPPSIVFEYTARPQKAIEYYNQAIFALKYYGNATILIERNRYRMIGHLEENGMKHLIERPGKINNMRQISNNVAGVHTDDYIIDYIEFLIEKYIESYCHLIPSKELLQEIIDYSTRNTDRVIAFGYCLMALKTNKKRAVSMDPEELERSRVPQFKYKMVNGRMVRFKALHPNQKRAYQDSGVNFDKVL